MFVCPGERATGPLGTNRFGGRPILTASPNTAYVPRLRAAKIARSSTFEHRLALERAQFTLVKAAWRYRYFLAFALFGFLSILLEVALVEYILPAAWPNGVKLAIGFLTGMTAAYWMNARLSFSVPRRYFWQAFALFALVSTLSYALNHLLSAALLSAASYTTSRFIAAGLLFVVAYNLHRRLTFRYSTRNLGLAVYANAGPDLQLAHETIGALCDHIHMDLIDETMKPNAAPVDLEQVAAARSLWRWHPICLHVMSKTPLKWIEECHQWVDQVLVHVDTDDDPMEVITRCRLYGLKVGIVWHHTVPLSYMMAFLPHVDFVMILGIEHPGRSGQVVMEEALHAADFFASLASRYGYEIIFDGGVTKENLDRIPAPILVSSSHVLKAKNPVIAALSLMAGGGHE